MWRKKGNDIKGHRNFEAGKHRDNCSRFKDPKKPKPKLVMAKTKNEPHLYPSTESLKGLLLSS